LQAADGLGRPQASALPRLLHVTTAREHGDGVVATARELPDRDAAEALKGARIFVSRASFPTPAADEYYWVDLVGLAVVNRQGEALGTVADLLDTGVHSVLRVTGAADGVERLIPFVAAYVDDVDRATRRITVDWGMDF
jgi:16S rRNA processing protein RimM